MPYIKTLFVIAVKVGLKSVPLSSVYQWPQTTCDCTVQHTGSCEPPAGW